MQCCTAVHVQALATSYCVLAQKEQVLAEQRQQLVDETQARAAEQKAWRRLKNSAGAATGQ